MYSWMEFPSHSPYCGGFEQACVGEAGRTESGSIATI